MTYYRNDLETITAFADVVRAAYPHLVVNLTENYYHEGEFFLYVQDPDGGEGLVANVPVWREQVAGITACPLPR